jgi:uncharacterized membrane protein
VFQKRHIFKNKKERKMNLITKIWITLLIGILLVFSIFISFFLFLAVLFVALITLPYIWYIQWKTKKELEKMDIEYEIIEIRQIQEGDKRKNEYL